MSETKELTDVERAIAAAYADGVKERDATGSVGNVLDAIMRSDVVHRVATKDGDGRIYFHARHADAKSQPQSALAIDIRGQSGLI